MRIASLYKTRKLTKLESNTNTKFYSRVTLLSQKNGGRNNHNLGEDGNKYILKYLEETGLWKNCLVLSWLR
jgi:hypothetical protein